MWPTTRILIAATIVGSLTAQAIDKSKSSIIHLYQIGPWIVQSELDPKTDKPFVIVQTPLDSKAGPYLKVNCEEGKPYIAFGIPGARWNKDEEISVTLRIDKGEGKRARYATAGETLVATVLSQATYERLSQAHLISALIEREDGSNWKLELPVDRTPEAFKPMLEACPIHSAATWAPAQVDSQ
jgi:hypothetical protein